MDSTQLIENRSLNSFWRVLPKMTLAIIVALVVQVIAFIVLLLLTFGIYLVYSIVFEPQVLKFSELLDALGAMFGVTFFVAAYLCPGYALCAGSLGFPIAIIGWRFKLIQKRTSIVVGFFLGIVCAILFELVAYSGVTRSANGITYMIDGARTIYGWIEFSVVVVVVGLLGALGGYTFWFIWDKLTPRVVGDKDVP